jgi:Rad3-related DNA helicase
MNETNAFLFEGETGAGKTTKLLSLKLHHQADNPVFMDALLPLSDMLQKPPRVKLGDYTEIFIERCNDRILIVDNLQSATGRKAEIIKRCVEQAKTVYAATTKESKVNMLIKSRLEEKGYACEFLRGGKSKPVDLTYVLIAVFIVALLLMGMSSYLVTLAVLRYMYQGTKNL